MNRHMIGVLALGGSLLIAGSLGGQAAAAAILAIGIVLVYGLILSLVQRARAECEPPEIVACQLGAVMLTPLWGTLVFAWGRLDDLPFIWSLVAWTVIILSGTAVKAAAEWHERKQETLARMRVGFGIGVC